MTREEELDWLYRLRSEIYVYMPKEWLIPMNEALDMVIKALEQEPSEDWYDLPADEMTFKQARQAVKDLRIMLAEYLTQEPKTGHWIRWYEQKENDKCIEHIPHCKCSECGKEYDPHSSQFIKFCNECGARMVGEEDVSQ